MAAQHGNVIVTGTTGGDRYVQRDHTEITVPWSGTIHQRAADASRVYVVKSTGDLEVYDGLTPSGALVDTITRPSGTFVDGIANIGPSGLWMAVDEGTPGFPDATLRWDGSSWTRHPSSGAGDTNPFQRFHLPTSTGFYYCHGPGTSVGSPLKHRTTGGTVTTINTDAALTTFAGTTVTGTRTSVAQVGSNLFVAFQANVGGSTWSGIWKITTSGTVVSLIQLAGYNSNSHQTVVTDTEGGLWAIATHTASGVRHLIRFDTDGTVIDAWAPTFTIADYGLHRGPRLGPYSQFRYGLRFGLQQGGF